MPYKDPKAQRAAQRRHYEANREAYQARTNAARGPHREKRLGWYNAIKDVPCTDCGGRFPPFVMDFDHIGAMGEKLFDVGMKLSHSGSIQLLADEIGKCELVCANCHRIRTMRRKDAARRGEPDPIVMTTPIVVPPLDDGRRVPWSTRVGKRVE